MSTRIFNIELLLCTIVSLVMLFIPTFPISLGGLFGLVNIIFICLTIQYLYIFRRNSLFCFELFFAVSFWVCCFLMPYISDTTKYQWFSILEKDQKAVVLLSIVGYLFYLIGLSLFRKKNIKEHLPLTITKQFNYTINTLMIVSIIAFFGLGGWAFIYTYNTQVDTGLDNRLGNFGSALNYMILFLNIATFTNFNVNHTSAEQSYFNIVWKLNKLYLLCILSITVFFMIAGYRSGAMQIFIPFLIMLFSVKRISSTKLILLIIASIFILTAVGRFRTHKRDAAEKFKNMDFVEATVDFHAANYATVKLYQYVEYHGSTNGSNYILQIISPIPFAQLLLSSVTDIKSFAPASSTYFTKKMGWGYGLGTNLIGDLYYSFGFIGVVILMVFLGWAVRRSSISNGIYSSIIYLILSGNAIFAPRVEYFYILRSLGFAIIIIFIINKIIPYKQKPTLKRTL